MPVRPRRSRSAPGPTLFDLGPDDDVLGLVSVAPVHHAFAEEALDTLALLRDVMRAQVWVVLFDRALRGGPFLLEDPLAIALPPLSSGAASGSGPSEDLDACCRGALQRVQRPLDGRPLKHMVVLSMGVGAFSASRWAFTYDDQPLPSSVLVREPGRRNWLASRCPDVHVMLAEEVRGPLRSMCEQRVLNQVLLEEAQAFGGTGPFGTGVNERPRVRL